MSLAVRARSRFGRLLTGGALALAVSGAPPVAAQSDVYPAPPRTWFEDRAGLVSPSARLALDHRLEALEEKTGVRLVILTERSLPEDAALEDYTLRSLESWTVWRREQPSLAFFVFSESRKMRLEVGYGAEAAVTDLEARRILDEAVTPAFRRGDYEGGFARAIDALSLALEGELPPLRKQQGRRALDQSFVLFLVIFVVLWLFVIPLLARRSRSRYRRQGAGAPWVIGGGPWVGGGGWGSGGSSGGSVFTSGGGFSGGGSVFGGGGASGDW